MSEPTPIGRFTDEAFQALRKLADNRPELWQDPRTDFLRELHEMNLTGPVEHIGLTALERPQMPLPETPGRRQRTDAHALRFSENIQGLETRHLADPNLLAWISCQHLLEYGILRWPILGGQKKKDWVKQHFLPQSGRELTNSSVAGRPLWLAEISRRAAGTMGTFTAQQALDHFARNTETYHIQNEFQVLRAPLVLGGYMQSMLEDALGASGAGVREIARDMNRAAGARLLDAMGRGQLREILEESVDRVMRMPECVSDRRKLRGRKNLQILSLGAGVQSSCMALMAEHGHEGFKKPDCAIFADTGWEPAAVYRHLDWLENELSYPVYRVSAGNIRDDLLEGHTPTGKNFISIPVYTVGPDGKPGLSKRQCTSEYKLKPIFDKIRTLLEITPGKRAAKDQHADVWIGITTDEVQRMKPSREEYITNQHPFIEKGISRQQLVDWFDRNNPGRELPRSACIGCPFRSNAEWKHLQNQDLSEFEDAAFVDDALRQMPRLSELSDGEMYLNRGRIPLREVNLDTMLTDTEIKEDECEGMCRI